MDKTRSAFTERARNNDESRKDGRENKAKGDSISSSHTQFYKKERDDYKRITSAEYQGLSESISGSSDTFQCVHGPGGKRYSEKGRLKRNLVKGLDPIPLDPKWQDKCPPLDWDVAKKLEFLVRDRVGCKQVNRIQVHIKDFARISQRGYRVDTLQSLCSILDFLIEDFTSGFRDSLISLLQNLNKPIILNASSDVVTYFDIIQNYIGYLGYMLIRLEDDELFNLVSEALIWQLSTPDSTRGHSMQKRHMLAAAGSVLYQTVARMLALATPHRFSTYLNIAFILACDSSNNCIEMIKENIIENIMSRFSPSYPDQLPPYEWTPGDPRDINIKLGDSSIHMSTTLSLLLVLLKTLKCYLNENPKYQTTIPVPDYYAQRCFIWAYRYECRAEHRHERITLTVIAHVLLKCYGDRLIAFSTLLMPDVMTMSVLTEIPPRQDWTRFVRFNTKQRDVWFKKVLIYLSVDFLKVFPYNKFMVVSQLWLLGLMYLLDPCLWPLRAHWSLPLFAELRHVALQALVCILPNIGSKLATEYGLIRRIMWYIDWYTESPYELPVLYWCVRLIQVSSFQNEEVERTRALQELFKNHGIVIIMNLCYTLLKQKQPPVEKSQAIISVCLRILASALSVTGRLPGKANPKLIWPDTTSSLAMTVLDMILTSLENNLIISDRLMISTLYFIWELTKYEDKFTNTFVSTGGVYKLLDLITMTKSSVQCMCLAILCDVAQSGGVSQIVTWRAPLSASNAYPNVVARGSNIIALLAAVFRDECHASGVKLDSDGVIESLDNALMSKLVREEIKRIESENKSEMRSLCLIAADLCGSRMSKAFALLYLLSEDLAQKVALADEAYNLYKNINVTPQDEPHPGRIILLQVALHVLIYHIPTHFEVIMLLCSHYLTLKLNETWTEIDAHHPELLPQDSQILQEFLLLNEGWSKEIKKQQMQIIERDRKKGIEEETSLYDLLGRIRLNIALDALREVRCIARSSDTSNVHAMIQAVVHALSRRSEAIAKLGEHVIRTYSPPLDDQNVTGQYVRIPAVEKKINLKSE